MIDVIFLLLTFFIYSMTLMIVQPNLLPVTLAAVGSGGGAEAGLMRVLTIDKAGDLYLNQDRLSWDELDGRLTEWTKLDPQPGVYLAMEASGNVDRGPTFVRLVEMVSKAGLKNVSIVGSPPEAGGVKGDK